VWDYYVFLSESHVPLGPLGPLQTLLGLLFDARTLQGGLREIGFDTERSPLGSVTQETLAEGLSVLKALSLLLAGGSAPAATSGGGGAFAGAGLARDDPVLHKLLGGGSGGSSGGGSSSGPARANPQHVRTLSDRFYTLIPHISKRSERLPALDSPRQLREKMDMLDALVNAQAMASTPRPLPTRDDLWTM